MDPVIQIQNLTKTYSSGFRALNNINLDIRRGEIFALLGPNGAGKSTLLRCLNGFVKPTAGQIVVNQRAVYPFKRERDLRAVRAFKQGMGPIVTALMIASGWLLATANTDGVHDWPLWVLTAAVTLIVWRTKINMFWLLGIGAVLGASGVLAV